VKLRRAVPSLVLTSAALIALGYPSPPSVGAPVRKIEIRGAHSGSDLTLALKGRRLVVKGHLARRHPVGCRFVKRRHSATCRLAGVSSLIVNMGPSGDRVSVLDRLPLPLVAYLGDGEDKLIGNGESDLCFPQGARRNRCVGGGGDDVCITGPLNTDCVGGPGNDVCKTGTGSDGCWGGPGRDVCRMGPGSDGCHGDGGKDLLFGGSGRDRLYGGRDFDFCDGGPGVGRSRGCDVGPRR
jgi:RTX calcium-binding nonapeptide repeat (4 copies)